MHYFKIENAKMCSKLFSDGDFHNKKTTAFAQILVAAMFKIISKFLKRNNVNK